MLLAVFTLPLTVQAQRVGVLAPDSSERSRAFAEKLVHQLGDKIKVLDIDLAHAGYLSVSPPAPFNLTVEESRRIGSAIGCDAFVLIRSANQRRSAFGRAEYYEAFAVVYVVSARTGRLIWWKIASDEASSADPADRLLDAAARPLSDEISRHIRVALATEINEDLPIHIEEIPAEGSPAAKNFRPPVPYRRIKPDYMPEAALYEITATVEALVDLDATGVIRRIEIVRWAGFALDESVEKAIRQMNWRPAERNGKSLAMRFLLRYNFKKLEKDPPE